MKNEYLTIEVNGQENIGFIDAGVMDMQDEEKVKEVLVNVVEKKLIEALESHFDFEVKIRSYEIIESPTKSCNPLSVKYTVIIGDEDEDYEEVVVLNKTWLY